MNLQYYTLWVENEPEWLESTIEYVSDIVLEHGFILKSEQCLSAEEFYEKTKSNLNFLDKFDLILTDFNLGEGDNGNVLIKKIRENNRNPFTDIIFYGQDQEAINQKLNDHFIEGVYKAPREIGLFSEKFEKVFVSTIKKMQDISMMRGLVISEASDMAMRILRLIKNYIGKTSEGTVNELRSYILNKIIKQHIENNEKFVGKAESMNVDVLLEERFFDDSKKLRILDRIFKQHKIANFSFYEDYLNEVINVRNELGHCEEIEKDGVKILSTLKGEKTFSHNECVEIRKKIILHQKRLDEIEFYIQELKGQ
ncbi:hypothetical protein [Haliscomenobacter sp.]|uniref:hypothetical protein n=1 Tax=Haliscomenobacter sp. TaxID=2717303 RepID=UPI003BAD886F